MDKGVVDIILDFLAENIEVILSSLGIIFVIILLILLLAPTFYNRNYKSFLHILFKGRIVALLLSHGGLHFLLFVGFFSLGCALIGIVKNESVASFHQVIYTFYGDTLHNYKLSSLKLTKDMSRRPGDFLNDNDINIEYSYTRDSSKLIPTIIKKFNNTDSVDLVSKVRMFNVNERPLEIESNPRKPIHFYKDYHQMHRRVKYSNKDRFIYYFTTTKSVNHSYDHSFAGKDLEKNYEKMNPYYSFWLGLKFECIPDFNDSTSICLLFSKTIDAMSSDGITEPINVEKVIPEPSERSVSKLIYKGKEKIDEVINNGGIYITAVDPVLKAKADEKQIIYTVLAGTIFAFCLDLLIQLILKWKRIKEKK